MIGGPENGEGSGKDPTRPRDTLHDARNTPESGQSIFDNPLAIWCLAFAPLCVEVWLRVEGFAGPGARAVSCCLDVIADILALLGIFLLIRGVCTGMRCGWAWALMASFLLFCWVAGVACLLMQL